MFGRLLWEPGKTCGMEHRRDEVVEENSDDDVDQDEASDDHVAAFRHAQRAARLTPAMIPTRQQKRASAAPQSAEDSLQLALALLLSDLSV
eukprot:525584-Rhodomonas_salina.1